MREPLAAWVNSADALQHRRRFNLVSIPEGLEPVESRSEDYHTALIGELFARMRNPYGNREDWSRLATALTQIGAAAADRDHGGVLPVEIALFAGTAYYLGGYSASALLTLHSTVLATAPEPHRACAELLGRVNPPDSELVKVLVRALRRGDAEEIARVREDASVRLGRALGEGPTEWVGWRLLSEVLSRFAVNNVRAVLPDGNSEFWTPLVQSFLSQEPPVWDFFPSQSEAIRQGLLSRTRTFSLQMPTGAGKTALSESLLYQCLTNDPDAAAILVVPYRSLASELRRTLVKRLNRLGLPSRCAYGGTVPTGDEVQQLADTRALVATPEALSGLLTADPGFLQRIALVVVDEGHLIDSQARGVGLELLLARLKAREGGAPRFIFVSAIVPNIEEINAWLGGDDTSVVRSDFRPALAEFAVLRTSGAGVQMNSALELHPLGGARPTVTLSDFLGRSDFLYRSPTTNRLRTYSFTSFKTQSIATARKALPMGGVAVFAANKKGNQGAEGLAEELLAQLEVPLPLPRPDQLVSDGGRLAEAVEYVMLEFGPGWVGTRALRAAVLLHHGDIPQETREVLEGLMRDGVVRLAICTNTLAEGVNLPLRTLVLYSVQRRRADGAAENLLTRDIKNLVGRAGRPGSTTNGLVICANANQWHLVRAAAAQEPGERVTGALLGLMQRLRSALQQQNHPLSNDLMEGVPELYSLIDGIDATLIDLAVDEIGDEEVRRIAVGLASETFASRQARDDEIRFMEAVFENRASRVTSVRGLGRLSWVKETGARLRLLASVEADLLPIAEDWSVIDSPFAEELIGGVLDWATALPDVNEAISKAYRDDEVGTEQVRQLLVWWLQGLPHSQVATRAELAVDRWLGIHTSLFSYTLQMAIEQGIVLLKRLVEAEGGMVSSSVVAWPEHVRFGVPNAPATLLLAGGIRHRRGAVALAEAPEIRNFTYDDAEEVTRIARDLVLDRERWVPELGSLVWRHTAQDLGATLL